MTFKFSENETVESLDAVDENLRGFYVKDETSDQYVVNEALRPAAAAWDGIAHTNANIRKENKSLKGGKIDLSPLADYGATPQEIAEAFNARTKELSEALDGKKDHVNPEKIRKEMKKAHQAELEVASKRADTYKAQLYDTLVTNVAMHAINEHKGNAELLLGFVTKQVRMEDVDGKLVPRVIDEDGDHRIGGAGSLMTVAELVKDMKSQKKFASLFQADVNPGSGPPNNRTSSGGPSNKGKQMTSQQRIQAALDRRQGR